MLEVRHIDQWTVEEELVDAVTAAAGANRDTLRAISLRKGYSGTRVALIVVPTASCQNVIAHGWLCLGMMSCRVRQGEQKTRCFRCLKFVHMSSQCKGPYRSLFGRRCESIGYREAKCGATSVDAKEFGS